MEKSKADSRQGRHGTRFQLWRLMNHTSSLLSFFNPICSLLQNLPASNFDLSEKLADGQFAQKGTTRNTVGNYFDDVYTVNVNSVSSNQTIYVILNFQDFNRHKI